MSVEQGRPAPGKIPDLPLSQELVAAVAHHLDFNSVPNVLWGNYLLTVFGVPSIVADAEFVVPDSDISAARAALCNAGLKLCVDQGCVVVTQIITRPAPDAHFHITTDTSVCLRRQSRTLFNISDLNIRPITADPETDLIYASNPSLPRERIGFGEGSFHPSLYPVRIPSVRCFTEACLLNFLREVDGLDRSGPNNMLRYDAYFLSMVAYMVTYVYRPGVFNTDSLPPRFRDFVNAIITGDPPFQVAREKLIASEGEAHYS